MNCIVIFLTALIILCVVGVLAMALTGDKDYDGNEELWSFDNCHYRGNCLLDCPHRIDCPFYTYKEEMGYDSRTN